MKIRLPVRQLQPLSNAGIISLKMPITRLSSMASLTNSMQESQGIDTKPLQLQGSASKTSPSSAPELRVFVRKRRVKRTAVEEVNGVAQSGLPDIEDFAFQNPSTSSTNGNSKPNPPVHPRVASLVKCEVGPPDNWEKVLQGICLMRPSGDAPVDSMGCEKAGSFLPPKERRFAVLASALFSSQTKDQVTHGVLQPSRRRSLFTLASSMLIFSSRAGNLPELIPIVKSSLTDVTVDPYLRLVNNIRLRAAAVDSLSGRTYGSEEDDLAALKSLSAIESDELQLKQTTISHLMSRFENLSEDDLSGIKKQLLEEFSPDESYHLGAPYIETSAPCSPLAALDFLSFDEAFASTSLDEVLPDASGSHSGRRTSMSSNSLEILSVNQLLDSVLVTSLEVASLPVSTTPLPYDQVKDQCEALVTCKQQKMSVLRSFKHQDETKAIVIAGDCEKRSTSFPDMSLDEPEGIMALINSEPIQGIDQMLPCSMAYEHQCFRLPPASPYEKFLRAAGC